MAAKMKKSQVSLFVIIGILIIGIIIIFFLFRTEINPPIITPPGKIPDIQAEMEKCVQDETLKAVDIILPQGGYINPYNYKLYENNKVAYLCYNKNYYLPCVNQDPMYIQSVKNEIKRYITPKIKDCFYNLEQNYRSKGYEITTLDTKIDVDLKSKLIIVDIDKKLVIKKAEETRNYEKFEFNINSPIYDLAYIATEIANQEARFCYFEYLGYSLEYPRFSIEKKEFNAIDKIYIIKEKSSGKTLLMAIKGCSLPGGL